MLATSRNEHLVVKDNPAHPQPVYKVIKVPATPQIGMIILLATIVSILFFIIDSRKVQIYIADTRFQGRNQEKHMVIWL
jgi:hypothetical protein